MSNRELDMFVLGLSGGGLACLWLGYELRRRVERWQTRRSMKRHARGIAGAFAGDDSANTRQRTARRSARSIPFGRLSELDPSNRPPLTKRRQVIPLVSPFVAARIDDGRAEATETARILREDAVAALTGAGYKRRDAEAALDACTLAERASGLEPWITSALRQLTTKP